MSHARAGRLKRKPRTSMPRDLLSGVHGSEINWDHVPGVLAGRQPGRMPYVYFIAEAGDGYIKIGTARHPVKRLRELQTGNPRHLKIERVIHGDTEIEKLMHGYFRDDVVGGRQQLSTTFQNSRARDTEWFDPGARERIFEAAEEIWYRQVELKPVDGFITIEMLQVAVAEAMDSLGHTLRGQDELRFLARTMGYAVHKVG